MNKILSSYLIVLLLGTVNLYSQDESYWDKASLSATSLWGKTKDYSNGAWDKTKEYSSDTWDKTKKYSHQGKNIFIEQTLINGINTLTDNTKIKIVKFDIDDKINDIDIVMYLNGEDKNLTIKINDFSWGVSSDDKYIVFENLNIDMDIPWINYLMQDIIKRDGGKLIVPNKTTTFSLLYSLKPNIKIKDEVVKKDKFDFVYYPYDKEYFKINKFNVIDNNITIDIFTKGNKNNILCNIDNYILRTANGKTIIALQNIEFKSCNRPWIKSIIQNQNSEIYFDFSKKLYLLFGGKED